MGTDLEAMAANTLARARINPEQLRDELGALGERWSVDGMDLKLSLPVKPMARAAAAVAHAAQLADEMDHHPTITVEYAGVTLRIHTHDAKAITVTDLVYAARFERWLRANGY
jgi:4a-hydroxytetrahydrobiopterin dehydratase